MGAHACQRAAAYGPEGMTQAGGGSQTCYKAGAALGGSCMFSGAGWCLCKEGNQRWGAREVPAEGSKWPAHPPRASP